MHMGEARQSGFIVIPKPSQLSQWNSSIATIFLLLKKTPATQSLMLLFTLQALQVFFFSFFFTPVFLYFIFFCLWLFFFVFFTSLDLEEESSKKKKDCGAFLEF